MTDLARDVREWIAEDQHGGLRLDKALSDVLEGLSRSRIKALIEDDQLTCNGVLLNDPTAKIVAGAHYALTIPAPRAATPQPEDIPLDILFEDDDLVVINKRAGMAVHPAVGNWSGTLVHALLHHCKGTLSGIGGVERPGIVHRLDKDTSGVMVVAKHDASHQSLSAQFADRTASRRYIAFCRSAPKPRAGRVETGYGRSGGDRRKFAVEALDKSGTKNAITDYETLTNYGQQPGQAVGSPAASKLACRLKTGRTHQIRVHMAHMGCPLLGDPVYGRQAAWHAIRTKAGEELKEFRRQALHAEELSLIHPTSGEALVFTAAPPKDMQRLEKFLERL